MSKPVERVRVDPSRNIPERQDPPKGDLRLFLLIAVVSIGGVLFFFYWLLYHADWWGGG